MKNNISAWKVICVLCIFSPLALLPTTSRAALLISRTYSTYQDKEVRERRAIDNLTTDGISREHAEEILSYLSHHEVEVLALTSPVYLVGAESKGVTDSLESNETVAIVLTLIMLALIVGAVEISRH
jgi:hypothetical protein